MTDVAPEVTDLDAVLAAAAAETRPSVRAAATMATTTKRPMQSLLDILVMSMMLPPREHRKEGF